MYIIYFGIMLDYLLISSFRTFVEASEVIRKIHILFITHVMHLHWMNTNAPNMHSP